MLTCPRSSLSFHSNAHHHGSLPQQLGVVWDLLLKADPEGPSPIFHAALRHRFHTHTGTPLHVSLQHTKVKKLKLSKRGELPIPRIASPGGASYDFLSKRSRIGWPWRTNGLGAHPGFRHGDDGPRAAGAE